ncbi:glutathione peroxidase [Zwartia vadi]|uniref:glutathione peroxidase n=1 Tax=Zwartia vadi TaxID=3058168 RepID=UPI0025B3AC96|nr:glutathione peroxidase [Zwartia vadi]MDN3986507.1 glutathione peroxidase [Zwartia vadi]
MALPNLTLKTITGQLVPFSDYAGKVLLIVNVASQCGFTKQYKGLQQLHLDFAEQGLVVMGFPCNQFGHQEPGDEQSIKSFCELDFGVTFPMFAKIDVNGAQADPLYEWLKSSRPGLLGTEMIKWNFTKFLVGRDGQVIKRFAPSSTPEAIREEIMDALS